MDPDDRKINQNVIIILILKYQYSNSSSENESLDGNKLNDNIEIKLVDKKSPNKHFKSKHYYYNLNKLNRR